MAASAGSPQRPLVFIFDGPVSCSKLFGRLLSTHPQLESTNGYPYLLAGSRGPETIPVTFTEATQQKLATKWQKELREEDLQRWARITYAEANSDVAASVEAITEKGKIAVVQEHAALCIKASISLPCLRQGVTNVDWRAGGDNPTRIDDEILRACVPVILVRHPALFIPSFYRKQIKEQMLDLDDEAFQLWISMDWVRILYEYFTDESSGERGNVRAPLVIDAQDIVHNTAALTAELGRALDIDPEGFQETWEPMVHEPVPEGVVASFHDRLRNSVGIERGNAEVC